jgi:hypothetical protein
MGQAYLDLLPLFLNHRTFARSERPERVGKSTTELMTGRSRVLSASLHELLLSVLIWWSCRRESAGKTIDESQ